MLIFRPLNSEVDIPDGNSQMEVFTFSRKFVSHRGNSGVKYVLINHKWRMNGKDDTCHTCEENIDQFVCSSYILQVHPHSQTDVRDLGSG